ncbi:FIST signal transduction protein [Neptunicella sp. SCSIO 80796]|uniref:FIST signal transduction protein n=1 Tax=Neptunicella plasticusilytica TaxID=3117012 RepID=UPI003A4DCF6D
MQSLINSVQYCATVQQSSVLELLRNASNNGAKSLLVLCCDDPGNDLAFLNNCLTEFDLPIFGGVFPGILYDDKVYEQGFLVVALSVAAHISFHPNLNNALQQDFSPAIDLDCPSMMVLVDGLADNIDYMIQQLFHRVGRQVDVIGGGAGSLSFEQKPCIICNQGIFADAMLLVALEQHIELAIGHGWQKLAGPFLATHTQGNRIDSLNFQSALSVYQDAVSQHTELNFDSSPFFDIAKTYPFGLERLDDDMLVRDPIAVEGQSLVCVGNIPENTMLYILHGEPDTLISAASDAVRLALNVQPQPRIFGDAILFDCISRKLFLTGQYQHELSAINARITNNSHLIGALVLGEIASSNTGVINFHNKTAVTALSYQIAPSN